MAAMEDLEQANPVAVGEDVQAIPVAVAVGGAFQAIPVAVGEGLQAIPVAPAVGERELGVSDKGAVKYIKSVSQSLVGVGFALNTFGCTFAFRTGSGFSSTAQFWFMACAISYFLVSVNTAGIANAIQNRLGWLEASYVMAWLQMVYLIIYSWVLAFLFAKPKDSATDSGSGPKTVLPAIATTAVLVLIMHRGMCFGRPQSLARIFQFYGRYKYNTVAFYEDKNGHLD